MLIFTGPCYKKMILNIIKESLIEACITILIYKKTIITISKTIDFFILSNDQSLSFVSFIKTRDEVHACNQPTGQKREQREALPLQRSLRRGL